MLRLDHFCLFSPNHYRSAFLLSRETGLCHYDGGFFPNAGVGTKIVPLSDDVFIEIEGFVDFGIASALAGSEMAISKWIGRPEFFAGWCFRSDTEDELREFAQIRGMGVDFESLSESNAQQMMNGDKIVLSVAPSAAEAWPLGQPNVYFWPDMNKHDACYPTDKSTGSYDGQGLSWIEVGGTSDDFDAYFAGMTASKDHPIRFNGKSPGLYSIGAKTPGGEVEIRRQSV